jgi:hypothetical protein
MRFFDHTQTNHTRSHSSGREVRPSQKPLPDNKQQSQNRDIHARSGIRTRNRNKREAADPRLRLVLVKTNIFLLEVLPVTVLGDWSESVATDTLPYAT